MASVYAFQPRSSEPAVFVSEDADELYGRLGEFLPGPQCDGCGNWSYQLGAHYGFRWTATCAVDPSDAVEEQHPAPCGHVYTVGLHNEDEVTY